MARPEASGSVSAVLHRVWFETKATVGLGYQSILNSVEQAEDRVKKDYEKALAALRQFTTFQGGPFRENSNAVCGILVIMEPADVTCPQCGEEKGNPCRDSHTFHQARVEAAEAATEEANPKSKNVNQSAERMIRESTESRLESRRRKRIA